MLAPRFVLAFWLAPAAACDIFIPPAYHLADPGHADAPAGGPEASCVADCAARARGCSRKQCVRGCNLVIDRLVERQGTAIIACVATARANGGACDDRAFARCA
ncbi:MAG: hypothetical protein FWD17_18395, partial [Polyangiaceae bacterium]|nr:hypothetical protein [Polyangiaceae bacterium]